MIGIHRGLTTALREKMQLSGVRIEELEARKIFIARSPFSPGTGPYDVSTEFAGKLFHDRFELMKRWEEQHPGEKPFPDVFPEVVIALLRAIDLDDPMATVNKLISLAEEELALS